MRRVVPLAGIFHSAGAVDGGVAEAAGHAGAQPSGLLGQDAPELKVLQHEQN